MLSAVKLETKNSSLERVYSLLRTSSKPLSSTEIAKLCNFSARTVRYALKNLQKMGLVRKIPNLLDMRRCYYVITD